MIRLGLAMALFLAATSASMAQEFYAGPYGYGPYGGGYYAYGAPYVYGGPSFYYGGYGDRAEVRQPRPGSGIESVR